MLASLKGFMCPALYTKVSKRLLSNQIKEVLNIRLETPSDVNRSQLQLSAVTKNLNALNLDFFVNNLSEHEDRSLAVLDLLAKLRSTKFANTCLESTQFAAVSHLLENLTTQEIVPVLLDRPKYGIFLNNFTSFAVFQTLHEEKEYILGLPLVLKLISAGEVDSVFVQGYCLKASLEFLKKEIFENQPSDDNNTKISKGRIEEKKVRVKFIRNEFTPDVHNEMGKTILRIAPGILESHAKANIEILGLVLTKNYTALDNALNVKSINIYRDIGDVCTTLLLRENLTDLANKIDKLKSENSFDVFIDEFLIEASTKEATPLAEEQKQLIPIWQELRTQKKNEFENEISKEERKQHIEILRNEIATKKELLWFFDNEEKLELEIDKKKIHEKKSSGKKKSRAVDEQYIPPEIRKIN